MRPLLTALLVLPLVEAAALADTVEILSLVNDGASLTVTYSKDFATCAHLLTPGFALVHAQNFFCTMGPAVTVTTPLSGFTGVVSPGTTLQLCHGNDYSICSSLTVVAAAGPTLSIGGSCPGPMPVDVTGLTRGGRVAVLTSPNLGSTVMPKGPCVGGVTGLGAGLAVRAILQADGAGELHLVPTFPGGFCGQYVQVVDGATCELSGVQAL